MANAPRVTDLLEAGLKASSLRQSVIANNIANLQTPGYRRKVLEFEKHLAEALESGRNIDINDIEPEILEPRDTAADATGNDVNIDVEVGEMVKNAAMYKTYMRLMTRMYRQMELAIRGE